MKSNKKMLWINCISVVVVALFLLLPFWDKPGETQYDIVVLGDSIIGNVMGEVSVTDVVSERLGKSVFNGAFGGTTCSYGMELQWGSVTNTQWSMVKLADAIAYKDWSSPLGTMNYADFYSEVNLQALPYFKEKMDALAAIDFAQVDILIIEHGTNDYNGGRKLDNPEDAFDITTFGGALRYSLDVLQKAYPDMQIVLFTPIYCELGDNGEKSSDSWNWGYGVLDAYVELEKQIAQEYGVFYIDAYHESGIWKENAAMYLYDGLHLSPAGVEKLGEFLAESLKALGIE